MQLYSFVTQAKDLNLATTSAKEVGVRVPLASEAEQM